MISFQVQDMTCGGCAASIRRAVRGADANADVAVDLARRRVDVTGASVDAATLERVISEAGYTPVRESPAR